MSDVASLLPPNATGELRAQEAAHARLADLPASLLRTMQSPDAIPANLLPWLAWAFGVDGWDNDWTTAQKRAAVKAAWAVRTHKGTIGAVRHALAAVGMDVEVIEWFDDTPVAEPYTYRLDLTSVQVGASSDDLAKILNVVDTAKNLRSHMRQLSITTTTTGQLYHAGVCMVGSEIELMFGEPLLLDGSWALDGTHDLKGYLQ